MMDEAVDSAIKKAAKLAVDMAWVGAATTVTFIALRTLAPPGILWWQAASIGVLSGMLSALWLKQFVWRR